MHKTKKIPIVQLNEFLTCKLCKGYYVDATTIVECLHTFCRSCIVQYLEKNKYCPVCDVQVHKTKPLLNIRPDKIIQDIVYKLVPRLFQNEKCRRQQFYSVHPEARPSNLEQCSEAVFQNILSTDETICLTLNYNGGTGSPRYLKCPAGLSIVHLQKLLRFKYGLSDQFRVDIFHNQDCLSPHLTLIDVAYIYLWKRKGPLDFTYKIYENTNVHKRASATEILQESEVKGGTASPGLVSDLDNTSSSWKEVQLQISESGEMCFTNIDSLPTVNQEVNKINTDDTSEPLSCNEQSGNANANVVLDTNGLTEKLTKECSSEVLPINKKDEPNKVPESASLPSTTNVDCDNKSSVIEKCISTTTLITTASSTLITPASPSTLTVCTVSNTPILSVVIKPPNSDTQVLFNGKHKTKRNLEDEPVRKQAKPTILNHTLNFGIHHLSNNHPLKRNSITQKSVENTMGSNMSKVNNTSSFVNCASIPLKPTIINKECNSTPPVVNIVSQWTQNKTPTKLPCYSPRAAQNPVISVPKVHTNSTILKSKVPITTILNHKIAVKSKPSNSLGYKTLREPPKTWNPQIPRSLLLKGAESNVNNAKPAKFFKIRNNMPRYLGNPASGVKPLYQVHKSPEKEKADEVGLKADKIEIRKHSIVKIDPKTLKPVSEKAPETSSLSNQTELKINTSSVPIFSPLKLQSSPKNDRRSPKSPHSPKPKTSPSTKRDKLSLHYIPPNPFIPNLASPTLSPNQFLYPPGFPTYDHRLVAAYHNLLFGQQLAFAAAHSGANLNFDLNQRRALDAPVCSSKAGSKSPLPLSGKEKNEQRLLNTDNSKPITSEGTVQNVVPEINLAMQNNKFKKKTKETSKNEKSLEIAVEKLTQNRVSELKKIDANSEVKKDKLPNESSDISKDEKYNTNIINTVSNSINNEFSSNNYTKENGDKPKTEEVTKETNLQSMQNGDKTVSNNNTIEHVSFENVDKV